MTQLMLDVSAKPTVPAGKRFVRGDPDDFTRWLKRYRMIQEIEREAEVEVTDDDLLDSPLDDEEEEPEHIRLKAPPGENFDRIFKFVESTGETNVPTIAEALGIAETSSSPEIVVSRCAGR